MRMRRLGGDDWGDVLLVLLLLLVRRVRNDDLEEVGCVEVMIIKVQKIGGLCLIAWFWARV